MTIANEIFVSKSELIIPNFEMVNLGHKLKNVTFLSFLEICEQKLQNRKFLVLFKFEISKKCKVKFFTINWAEFYEFDKSWTIFRQHLDW